MPYIKVNIAKIKNYSSEIATISARVRAVKDDFGYYAGRLDWDIKSAANIDSRINEITRQLEAELSTCNKMQTFLANTATKYTELESGEPASGFVSKNVIDGSCRVEAVRKQDPLMGVPTNPESVFDQSEQYFEDSIVSLPTVPSLDIFTSGLAKRVAEGVAGFIKNIKDNVFDTSTKKTNAEPSIDVPKNHWKTNQLSGILDIFDIEGNGWNALGSILGYNNLILDTWENVVEQVEMTDAIRNDPTMTNDEKEYMIDKIEDLTNIEVALDTAGWGVGTIFGPAGNLISHIGNAINSDGVRDELMEGYREKSEAQERLDNADTFIEKMGAQLNVWGEEIESVVEVGREVVCEFVEDVVSDGINLLNNVVVEPAKRVWNGIGNFLGWW